MRAPIACSFTPTVARSQLGEWHELLAASVVATERVSPTQLSLRLADDLGQLEALVRLAQREKECCPFFDFAIAIEAGAVSFCISVPDEAAPVLDSFETSLT